MQFDFTVLYGEERAIYYFTVQLCIFLSNLNAKGEDISQYLVRNLRPVR
jgi:hypothetical protein